jgi:hypothetical protein
MRPEAEENTSRALSGELMRPRMRPSTQEEREAGERGDRASQREAKKFAEGGMVRGCSDSQMSGKGFRGEY